MSAPAGSRAYTGRAFILGALLAALLAFAGPYTVLVHHTAGMDADFINAGALLLFFLVTGAGNALLRRLRPAWGLGREELVVAYTMMVVAAAIPTWGLMANLLPILPGAYYYATPENNWAQLIQPHIPPWLAPQDPLAIKQFYEGAPAGQPIPWEAWAVPLGWWAALILAVYTVMVGMMVIMRRQWVEHERLVFPLTQLPLEMLRPAGPGQRLNPFCRSPLMWVGFAIPFALLSTHGLHYYFSYVPAAQIYSEVVLLRNTTLLRLFLSFPVIGFTYFINLDVAFSLWFFHLVARLQSGLFGLVGFEIPGHSETFAGDGNSPAVASQGMGAMAVLAAFCLYNARHHLALVWRKAWGRAPELDDRGEPLSYRAAVAATLGGLAVISLWLWFNGMPPGAVVFFLVSAFVVFFGLARIIAEGGVGFCRAQMVAPIFTAYGLGSRLLGPAGLTSLGLAYTWAVDIRTTVMASAINGMKLADAVGIRRTRLLLLAVGLAVLVALASAAATTLWLAYAYGGVNLQGWFFNGMPNTAFGFVADKINNPLDARVTGPRWAFTGVGALAMGLLMYARQRLPGWPLHYLGLPIGDTWVMSWVWGSILLGWLFKLCLLKYGGVRAYRAGRPFFLGLIIGQISCAGFWMVVDTCTGAVGNYIQIGVP
jgi:hypothetical protein